MKPRLWKLRLDEFFRLYEGADLSRNHRLVGVIDDAAPTKVGMQFCRNDAPFLTMAPSELRYLPNENQKAHQHADWQNNQQRNLDDSYGHINRRFNRREATKENAQDDRKPQENVAHRWILAVKMSISVE